jgi:hypothetical protein
MSYVLLPFLLVLWLSGLGVMGSTPVDTTSVDGGGIVHTNEGGSGWPPDGGK